MSSYPIVLVRMRDQNRRRMAMTFTRINVMPSGRKTSRVAMGANIHRKIPLITLGRPSEENFEAISLFRDLVGLFFSHRPGIWGALPSPVCSEGGLKVRGHSIG